MPYINRNGRRSMRGFGDVASETFNADGWLFTPPAATATPPATPEPSVWDKIGGALKIALSPTPVLTAPAVPVNTGMSTTTKIVLAGGALLVVALIARR